MKADYPDATVQNIYGIKYRLDLRLCREQLLRVGGAGRTLRDVAAAMGVSHMTLRRLLAGQAVGVRTIMKALRWLELDFEQVARPAEMDLRGPRGPLDDAEGGRVRRGPEEARTGVLGPSSVDEAAERPAGRPGDGARAATRGNQCQLNDEERMQLVVINSRLSGLLKVVCEFEPTLRRIRLGAYAGDGAEHLAEFLEQGGRLTELAASARALLESKGDADLYDRWYYGTLLGIQERRPVDGEVSVDSSPEEAPRNQDAATQPRP